MCDIPKFILIGLDDNSQPILSKEALAEIANGRIFSGGKRHYEIVASLLPPYHIWIPITVPLSHVFDQYQSTFQDMYPEESIIVFTSGDPLFYGFGSTIQREIPAASLRTYPTFNSLQMLSHRLLMNYEDMTIVSLTGRPWKGLDVALIERRSKIGILTDHTHTPRAIAQRLLDFGYNYYKIYVGEHLGNAQLERIHRLSLEEASQLDFSAPNCVIIHAPNPQEIPPRLFGIPDDQFELLDGRAKMITKMPIRLLSLQRLELAQKKVFWDIGFCTGSVSIEAKLLYPHLDVYAFEKREQGEMLMEKNSKKFGAPGINSYIGNFLNIRLLELPAPDAVFIGGHSGELSRIIHRLKSIMEKGSCIVFNSVSQESKKSFENAARKVKLYLEPPMVISLDKHNPITILKATI